MVLSAHHDHFGIGEPDAVINVGVSGPGVVRKAIDQRAPGLIQLVALKVHHRALGVKMPLTHQVGAIAGARQFAREGVCKVVGDRSLAPAHAQDAGVPLVLAGPERGPRR